MDPYAKPGERRVGPNHPKISHLQGKIDPLSHSSGVASNRSRKQRQADKQAVASERRAIKKSARRHLKEQLRDELKSL